MNPNALKKAVSQLMALSNGHIKKKVSPSVMAEPPAAHEAGESEEYEAKEESGAVADPAEPDDSELMEALAAALEKKKPEEE